MSEEVHGHEVLEQLVAAGGTLPVLALRDAATRAFGDKAKYYTCSAHGMTFDDLLGFLTQRNKVGIAGGLVTVFPENLCRKDTDPAP
jgi:probable metal-binding protein